MSERPWQPVPPVQAVPQVGVVAAQVTAVEEVSLDFARLLKSVTVGKPSDGHESNVTVAVPAVEISFVPKASITIAVAAGAAARIAYGLYTGFCLLLTKTAIASPISPTATLCSSLDHCVFEQAEPAVHPVATVPPFGLTVSMKDT